MFDCSATFSGVSLNNMLLPGSCLTSSLIAVLLRFRQEEIAVMSNIESMLYQVRVSPEHVDCLRFLWWPDGETEKPPGIYRMLVQGNLQDTVVPLL